MEEINLRDYQRKKGKYILPRSVYHQALWKIRDYYRLKEDLDNISYVQPIVISDMPRTQTNKKSESMESIAFKRKSITDEIEMIERALEVVPKEYRKGVWENIQKNQAYPIYASRSTYGLYKSKYIYTVARRMKLL